MTLQRGVITAVGTQVRGWHQVVTSEVDHVRWWHRVVARLGARREMGVLATEGGGEVLPQLRPEGGGREA